MRESAPEIEFDSVMFESRQLRGALADAFEKAIQIEKPTISSEKELEQNPLPDSESSKAWSIGLCVPGIAVLMMVLCLRKRLK